MFAIVNVVSALSRRVRACVTFVFLKIVYGARISFKGLPVLGDKIYIYIFEKGKIEIGKNLSVRRGFEIRATGNVKIGNGCFFNNFCTLTAVENITIGDNCLFGERVSIYDHDHGFREKDKLIVEQKVTIKAVNIGNNVWVGSNVAILKGVHIGDNSVIAANSVVYKDVPANTIVKSRIQQEYTE